MFFFKKKGVQENKNHLQEVLAHSFSQVRQDVQNVYEWLRFLHDQNQQQQRIIEDLRQQLVLMPKNKDEIRDLIDNHYSLDPIINRVAELENNLTKIQNQKQSDHSESLRQSHELITKSHSAMIDKLHEISVKLEPPKQIERVIEKKPQLTTNLQDKIIRNVTRNSKEYIKNILLKTIKKYETISGLQLREIIVNEQGLVSRSSFYRLLLELESEGKLSVTQEGKEKVYMLADREIITI